VSVPRDVLDGIERAGDRSVRHPWLQRLARAGFAARALVYAIVGTLALLLALGEGGRTTDPRGAIATIARAPFGKALVIALAVALAGLALWMLVEALVDPERRGRSGIMGALSRFGEAIAAVGHGALALAALRMAMGARSGPRGEQVAESWTARALELPAGRWLVLLAAGVVVVVGVRQAWIGLGRRFFERLDLPAMSARRRRWASAAGAAGHCAQGVLFALVGVFFAQAAIRYDPAEVVAFDGALATVARQPWGAALLGALAVGVLARAAYSLVEAAHRKLGFG
jgi:hypothetical protein